MRKRIKQPKFLRMLPKDKGIEAYVVVGSIMELKGYRPRIPKLGAWSVCVIAIVTSIRPLEVKRLSCNAPSLFNPTFETKRSEWLHVRILDGHEEKRWRLMADV
jgi:hypothetical protein